MCAALPGTLQQALRLQKNLGPRVAPVEVVIADKVLVEVLGGETAVAVAIQSFDLLFAVNRHPFARRPAEPAVQQTGFSGILKPQAPAAKRPLTDPKPPGKGDLGCYEIYNLPPNSIGPGTSLREIVDLRIAAGSGPAMAAGEY